MRTPLVFFSVLMLNCNLLGQISSDELIVRTYPLDKEINIAQIRTYQFKIEFSESMDRNSVVNGISFSPEMYHKYLPNYYTPVWVGNTIIFGSNLNPPNPTNDIHFDYIGSPFINNALKPNTSYAITLDTTIKTSSGKKLKNKYTFSFTVAPPKYDKSNIKEYAIELFKDQFGIDVCSPFIAKVYATSTNGRICDYWTANAYLENYPLRFFITEDGSFLRGYQSKHYPYLNDPDRIVYVEPKGIKKVLNVFLDYGNSDISQVYNQLWSHSQDSINNQYMGYFKSWGIEDTVLYFKNTNICINAAAVGTDAYYHGNLYPYLRSTGYDVDSYDIIIIMNMNPGSDICCAWQVSTNPGQGPFNIVCHDFRHQNESYANYTQADFNLYAFTLYFEEMQHCFGYEHNMPLQYFYDNMKPDEEVAHLRGKPSLFILPGIFGWDDTDSDGKLEIVSTNPFGLNCIPTSIPDKKIMESEISLYPNPVSKELTIVLDKTNNTNIEIFNSIGQIVFTGNFLNKAVINTTDLANGVFFIKVKNGETLTFKKFIKE